MDTSHRSRIPISGLKMSGPLALLWIHGASDTMPDPQAYLYDWLDRHWVNIVYITHPREDGDGQALCCIDRADAPKVAALLEGEAGLADHLTWGDTVGLVTIYPHRWSLAALGLVFQLLQKHGVHLHGMGSSIAGLSFVIDYDQLEMVGTLLDQHLQLPSNSSPPRSAIRVTQEPSNG